MRARTSSLHKTEHTRQDIKLPTFHDEHTPDRKLYPHHGPSSRSTHNKQWGHSLTANILPGTWYSDTSSNRFGAHLSAVNMLSSVVSGHDKVLRAKPPINSRKKHDAPRKKLNGHIHPHSTKNSSTRLYRQKIKERIERQENLDYRTD